MKALAHFAGGVILGSLIVLIPLIILTELNVDSRISQHDYSQSNSLPDEFRGIEGSNGLGAPSATMTDFGPLAIGFVVAMVSYVVVRRKRSP